LFHLVAIALFVVAGLCYAAASESGAVALFILGVIVEIAAWCSFGKGESDR